MAGSSVAASAAAYQGERGARCGYERMVVVSGDAAVTAAYPAGLDVVLGNALTVVSMKVAAAAAS